MVDFLSKFPAQFLIRMNKEITFFYVTFHIIDHRFHLSNGKEIEQSFPKFYLIVKKNRTLK